MYSSKATTKVVYPNLTCYYLLWHRNTIPGMRRDNLYVKKVRTNTGNQTIGYAACIIWDKITLNLKEPSIYQFSKQLKPYLPPEHYTFKIDSISIIYNFKIWRSGQIFLGHFSSRLYEVQTKISL